MKEFIVCLLLVIVTNKQGLQTISTIHQSSFCEAKAGTSIEGEWFLIPVLASDTAAGKIPAIKFNVAANKFSGNTGCNTMNGSFVIKQDALKFNESIVLTKMACAGYNEKLFLESLLKTNRYEIKDGVLQLMYNTTILSTWSRHISTNPVKQI